MTSAQIQEFALSFCLHPLGYDVQSQHFAHRNDGLHDGCAVGIRNDVAHKGLVDLDLVQRQAFQILQRGIARPEIIHREAHARLLQFAHFGDGILRIFQHDTFGQFELQQPGFRTGFRQRALNLRDEIRLAELFRADVHCQCQALGSLITLPGLELRACGPQHPKADRYDQSGLFSQGNELRRRDQAPPGMLPTQQHFCPDGMIPVINLYLVEQLQLPEFKGMPQVFLEFDTRLDRRLHHRIVETNGVAPGGFGLVHRGICEFHYVVQILPVTEKQHHSDARRGVVGVPAQLIRAAQDIAYLFGNRIRLRCRFVRGRIQRFQNHHEFVTAQPSDRIAIAHAAIKPLRHFGQQFVADVMPLGIVERFEVVQVDEQYRTVLPVTRPNGKGLLQAFDQQAAVRQSGQGVVESQLVNLRFGFLACADVGKHAEVIEQFAVLVAHRVDVQPTRINLAVLAPVPNLTFPMPVAFDVGPHFPIKFMVMSPRSQQVRILAIHLLRLVARNACECRVDLDDVPAVIGDHHARITAFEYLFQQVALIHQSTGMGIVVAAQHDGLRQVCQYGLQHCRQGQFSFRHLARKQHDHTAMVDR